MNLLDHVHGQDIAGGLARELIGAVRSAHSDGKGIDPGLLYEIYCLIWIGQKLAVIQGSLETMTVFLVALACFELFIGGGSLGIRPQ
ncbi:MAG: hypothetical protein FD153_472 [Rhodospirillaceae bacterium]|nr:MAG: hypothetical protein FD153_472 [Rhodospirillaceae bacterium]